MIIINFKLNAKTDKRFQLFLLVLKFTNLLLFLSNLNFSFPYTFIMKEKLLIYV